MVKAAKPMALYNRFSAQLNKFMVQIILNQNFYMKRKQDKNIFKSLLYSLGRVPWQIYALAISIKLIYKYF